jgi:hypothetical protein
MLSKLSYAVLASVLLMSSAAHADEAACKVLRDAGKGARNLNIKVTGYDFSNDTPDIYGSGKEVCTRVRDETVNGQPATLYTQDFTAPAGSTHAQLWVSKATGMLVRAEEDGDVKGKGRGHLSMIGK